MCVVAFPPQRLYVEDSLCVRQWVVVVTRCGISIGEYYSAIIKNKLLIHATTEMNLRFIMLSEMSQSKEYTVSNAMHINSRKRKLMTEGRSLPAWGGEKGSGCRGHQENLRKHLGCCCLACGDDFTDVHVSHVSNCTCSLWYISYNFRKPLNKNPTSTGVLLVHDLCAATPHATPAPPYSCLQDETSGHMLGCCRIVTLVWNFLSARFQFL